MDECDSSCRNIVLHAGPPEMKVLADQQFEFKELTPIFRNFIHVISDLYFMSCQIHVISNAYFLHDDEYDSYFSDLLTKHFA